MAKQGLLQLVAPTAEPVSLAEAAEHCRVETGLEDGVITRCVRAARHYVESVTGRQLVTATWRLTLDSFYAQALEPRPGVNVANLAGALAATADAWRVWQERGGGWGAGDVGVIRLPRPPLAGSVVAGVWTPSSLAVRYFAQDGTFTTAASTIYQVDGDREPARVGPAYGQVWPSTRAMMDAVQITYVAGTAAADVPEDLKAAVLLLASHWHRNRDAVGQVGEEMKLAVESLCGVNWTGEYQ